MIATQTDTARDRSQRRRKEAAKDIWREGRLEEALLEIRAILMEEMSPQIAAECYSTEAAILADMGDFKGSLDALTRMAPFLDAADVDTQGTFYNGRARAHKNLGDFNAALVDYSGAIALWQSCEDRNYEGAAFINLAELFLDQGDLAQARENVEHALEVLPDGSEYTCNAYDTKAKILLADGQTVNALRLIDLALEMAGDHEGWQKRFTETREHIKQRIIDVLVPVVRMGDLDKMKIQLVSYALNQANGSVTKAAEILGTSHQVIAYTADHNGLNRGRRKKSIIKHLS